MDSNASQITISKSLSSIPQDMHFYLFQVMRNRKKVEMVSQSQPPFITSASLLHLEIKKYIKKMFFKPRLGTENMFLLH